MDLRNHKRRLRALKGGEEGESLLDRIFGIPGMVRAWFLYWSRLREGYTVVFTKPSAAAHPAACDFQAVVPTEAVGNASASTIR